MLPYPEKKILNNSINNTYHPSEKQMFLIPMLIEEFPRTVGLQFSSCQVHFIELMIHKTLWCLLHFWSHHSEKGEESLVMSLSKCTLICTGEGRLGAMGRRMLLWKPTYVSETLGFDGFLLSYSANKSASNKQGLVQEREVGLKYYRQRMILELLVLQIYHICFFFPFIFFFPNSTGWCLVSFFIKCFEIPRSQVF